MTSSALTGNTSGLASATSPGLVGITTQTFAGVKTFQDGLAFTSASLSDVQATILGLKQYLHGTTYNGGIAPTVTSAQGGFTVARAAFVPYQCQDGTWRIKFNIFYAFTSATVTAVTASVNGIVFKNVSFYSQPVAVAPSSTANITNGYVSPNTGNIVAAVSSSVQTGFGLSGDVELNAKPTWAY